MLQKSKFSKYQNSPQIKSLKTLRCSKNQKWVFGSQKSQKCVFGCLKSQKCLFEWQKSQKCVFGWLKSQKCVLGWPKSQKCVRYKSFSMCIRNPLQNFCARENLQKNRFCEGFFFKYCNQFLYNILVCLNLYTKYT